jgi:hypothetical protein
MRANEITFSILGETARHLDSKLRLANSFYRATGYAVCSSFYITVCRGQVGSFLKILSLMVFALSRSTGNPEL